MNKIEDNILENLCNKIVDIEERVKSLESKYQRFNDEEDLFKAAVKLAIADNTIGAAKLQRELKIGYNKAARYIEELKELGIIGK